MSQYSCMLAFAGFCLPPQTHKRFSGYGIFRGASGPGILWTPTFLGTGIRPRSLNRQPLGDGEVSRSAEFLATLLVAAIGDCLARGLGFGFERAVPCWLPELRESRGNEMPVEWPPRRKQYREG